MWQPIETAPKDSTVVLLYLAAPWSEVRMASWHEPWGIWKEGDNPDSDCWIGSALPTHWMPLPEAP